MNAKWIVLAVVPLVLNSCLVTGCIQPAAFPEEFKQTAQALGASMVDQAIWDELLAKLRGHIKDPGLEAYTRFEIAAGARITGTDGDVLLESTGHGTGALTDDAREVILNLYRNSTTTGQKQFWLNLLQQAEKGEVADTLTPDSP